MFTVCRTIQLTVEDNVPITVQVYMRLTSPVICVPLLVVQIPTWINGRDVVSLANQEVHFFGDGK